VREGTLGGIEAIEDVAAILELSLPKAAIIARDIVSVPAEDVGREDNDA
jgi:hypothetical protein